MGEGMFNRFCLGDYSILTDWTSPFFIKGVSVVFFCVFFFFFFFRILVKNTKTLTSDRSVCDQTRTVYRHGFRKIRSCVDFVLSTIQIYSICKQIGYFGCGMALRL